MTTIRVNPENINTLKFSSPLDVDLFYFDSIYLCNIKCIYCHHERYSTPMKEEDFQTFLDTQIKSIKMFSLGCGMEPTMDKRLVKFAQILGNSKVKPTAQFKLQTNGTIIHTHNIEALRLAGVNSACISLDSVDPEVHRVHRGGSDLNQIISNAKLLRREWKDAHLAFMAVVTKFSLPTLEDFVKFSIDLGVNGMTIKKLHHWPENTMIKDHDWMRNMMLKEEDFYAKCDELNSKYGNQITFIFESLEKLKHDREKVIT